MTLAPQTLKWSNRKLPRFKGREKKVRNQHFFRGEIGEVWVMSEPRNVTIIGSGPAGYTAAIYAARANLSPLCIEGLEHGGQLMLTTDVENYPGFEKGIQGPDLMEIMRKQADRVGTEFITDNVTRVDFSVRPFKVWVGDQEIVSKSVIISTGAAARCSSRAARCRRRRSSWRPPWRPRAVRRRRSARTL